MWPGFESWTRRRKWVEFVLLLAVVRASRAFSSGLIFQYSPFQKYIYIYFKIQRQSEIRRPQLICLVVQLLELALIKGLFIPVAVFLKRQVLKIWAF